MSDNTTVTTTSGDNQSLNKDNIEYNIILFKKCDQIIIIQYIHSIISIVLIIAMLYIFYTILKKNN